GAGASRRFGLRFGRRRAVKVEPWARLGTRGGQRFGPPGGRRVLTGDELDPVEERLEPSLLAVRPEPEAELEAAEEEDRHRSHEGGDGEELVVHARGGERTEEERHERGDGPGEGEGEGEVPGGAAEGDAGAVAVGLEGEPRHDVAAGAAADGAPLADA